jgi:hypothetical protein
MRCYRVVGHQIWPCRTIPCLYDRVVTSEPPAVRRNLSLAPPPASIYNAVPVTNFTARRTMPILPKFRRRADELADLGRVQNLIVLRVAGARPGRWRTIASTDRRDRMESIRELGPK